MGDSDITIYLSLVAIFILVGAVLAFIIAWRTRKQAVRVIVGVLLLALAAICSTFLSLMTTLFVAAQGIAS